MLLICKQSSAGRLQKAIQSPAVPGTNCYDVFRQAREGYLVETSVVELIKVAMRRLSRVFMGSCPTEFGYQESEAEESSIIAYCICCGSGCLSPAIQDKANTRRKKNRKKMDSWAVDVC